MPVYYGRIHCFFTDNPLALTSTNAMHKRLGRRWKPLHRLTYVIAVLVTAHFLWLVKADNVEPLIYAFILLVLFLARLRPHGPRAKCPRASGFLR